MAIKGISVNVDRYEAHLDIYNLKPIASLSTPFVCDRVSAFQFYS